MSDELDIIRRLRPPTTPPDRGVIDAERLALMECMDAANRRTPQPLQHRSRKRLIAGSLVGLIAASGATAYALSRGSSRASETVTCWAGDPTPTGAPPQKTPPTEAVISFDPRADDPVQSCTRRWPSLFGSPAPADLAACADRSEQAAIIVVPGGPDACQDHDADPYVGPEEEQLRFASFRAELTARGARSVTPCRSLDDLTTLIQELLAKHNLQGWRIDRPSGSPPDCAQVEGFNQAKRLIVLNSG